VSSSPIPDCVGQPQAGAAASQGPASGGAAQRRTLDAPHQSAGYNPSNNNQRIDHAHLKRTVSLAMVLSRYGILSELKRVGSQLAGRCPIHDGSDPRQFVVHLASNNWFCFGDCNRGGSMLDFVALKERVSIARAARLVAEWFAIAPRPQVSISHRKPRSTRMTTRPSHRAYVVEDRDPTAGEDQSGFWTKVGSAWPHKDGKGLNVQLAPGIAVSGRLVLREYSEEQEKDDKTKRGKK
jgi:hypothetical protein